MIRWRPKQSCNSTFIGLGPGDLLPCSKSMTLCMSLLSDKMRMDWVVPRPLPANGEGVSLVKKSVWMFGKKKYSLFWKMAGIRLVWSDQDY